MRRDICQCRSFTPTQHYSLKLLCCTCEPRTGFDHDSYLANLHVRYSAFGATHAECHNTVVSPKTISAAPISLFPGHGSAFPDLNNSPYTSVPMAGRTLQSRMSPSRHLSNLVILFDDNLLKGHPQGVSWTGMLLSTAGVTTNTAKGDRGCHLHDITPSFPPGVRQWR